MDFIKHFSPWGRTSRSHYWLAVLLYGAGTLATLTAKDAVGPIFSLLVVVALDLIVSVATLRRLHDAGWSRWWALFCLFPAIITWDLLTVRLGASTWHFIEISMVIRLFPVLVGLLAAPRPVSEEGAPTNARTKYGM